MAVDEELKERAEAVKMIPIPRYFDKVIKPAMGDYYSSGDYSSDLEITNVCKCPLHDENTPSFRWYPETNTYFCWGCDSGGDIIELHRKFNYSRNGSSIPFSQAINFLENLSSGDNVAILGKITHVYDINSTSVELLQMGMTVSSVTRRLVEKGKQERVKVYNVIDDNLLAVQLKKLNALDAKKNIELAYQSL